MTSTPLPPGVFPQQLLERIPDEDCNTLDIVR